MTKDQLLAAVKDLSEWADSELAQYEEGPAEYPRELLRQLSALGPAAAHTYCCVRDRMGCSICCGGKPTK